MIGFRFLTKFLYKACDYFSQRLIIHCSHMSIMFLLTAVPKNNIKKIFGYTKTRIKPVEPEPQTKVVVDLKRYMYMNILKCYILISWILSQELVVLCFI